MLKNIIQKELKELWREDRVKWLCIIVAALLVTSVITSYRYNKKLKDDHTIAMRADREVWDNQRPKNPHAAAHFGFYLFKPVYPLSIFEPGVDRFTGATLFLEAHQRNNERFSNIADESDLGRFGFLSPAFILQFLLPLLIIVAGFNSISKEKESGNLSLLLSQGISAKKMFYGKWLSLFLLVAAIIIPLFIISLAVLAVQNAPIYNYAASGCMMLLYLLFYAVIINVVVFISSKAKQSSHAFIYSILFWVICCLLAPKLVANISQTASPLLTNEEALNKVKELNKGKENVHDKSSGAFKHLVDSLLKKYKVDSINQLPVNVSGVRLDAGEQTDTWNNEQVNKEQMKRLNIQQNIITLGSLFSPLIPSQQISMALANTDVYSHHRFCDSGERYRRKFVNIMNKYIAYESGLQESYTVFKTGDKLWKRVPVFSYQPPGFSALASYGFSFLALLLWLVISFFVVNKSIHQFKAV
ncbi:MAG TPA: ABC transporter permease subunit [Chitinophagaceae bacterium]|jgi:ABC-2 type transport system permease protein|nr:ABC transporter permease subunit [Chitinophagaceae bacterium]